MVDSLIELSKPTRASEPDWLGLINPRMRAVEESGIVEVFNYGRDRQGLIPLWVGEGDLVTPDFIAEAAKQSLARGETFYTNQRGVPELRAAIARYMTRVYGAAPGGGAFSPEQFFVTVGGMHALEIATRLAAGPGDEIIVPSPAWPNFQGAMALSTIVLFMLLIIALAYQRINRRWDYATMLGRGARFLPLTIGRARWAVSFSARFTSRML